MMFDREQALDALTIVTRLNDESYRLTLYAVICTEHGGVIARTAIEAVNGAEASNRNALQNGLPCEYHAVALALDPGAMPEFPKDADER